MTAIRLCLGALLLGTLGAASASAQPCYAPIPQAPDACGPGHYCYNWCGMAYGPSWCVYPPFAPFQGAIPGPKNCALNSPTFPTHPYARSPRDYFMIYDRNVDSPRPF
jgi:hypothetical protein